jgi:hypothetical protein
MRAFGFTVAVALCLAAAPGGAAAEGRHGSHFRGDFNGHRHFDGRFHRGFPHGPFFPFFVGPSVVIAPPVYAAPPAWYGPPAVYGAPPPYAPPTVYAAPAPPPGPMPRVVEFPGGRYELRGDGVTTPYAWVWIPNPPATPPPPPPPSGPPPPPTSAPDSPAPRRPAAQTSMPYRWTDEQGVTTWTDNIEKVPVRYRGQARQLTP